MNTSNTVAILAPVPLEHLLDGQEVAKAEGKVAFGSRAWEVFHKLDEIRGDQPVDVFIYASHSGNSGQPKVTWKARYIGHVEGKQGAHPDGLKFRPPSTTQSASDNAGHWAVFWEVQELQQLPIADAIRISDMQGYGRKAKYKKDFFPEGPILILAM
jgi:hypothetical protein